MHTIYKNNKNEKLIFTYIIILYFLVYQAHLFYRKIFRRNEVQMLHEETNLPVFIRVVIDLTLLQFLLFIQPSITTIYIGQTLTKVSLLHSQHPQSHYNVVGHVIVFLTVYCFGSVVL